jgi:hypothetical protein
MSSEPHGALTADVTQAFVHAPIDERVTTPVPEDTVGVEVFVNGEKKMFQRGQLLMFFKAQ